MSVSQSHDDALEETSHQLPPQRLIASVLAVEARNNPHRIISLITKSPRLEDGFREVTFGEFAGAAARTAKWLTSEFKLNDAGIGETITFIGLSDLRYSLMFFAVLLLRRKIFLPSPRNPPSVNLALLKELNCTKVVYGAELTELIKAYQANVPELEVQCLESISDLLSGTQETYDYVRTYKDASAEPALILHSSGSTGNPKSVSITHGSFSVYDPINNLQAPPGRKAFDLARLDFTHIPGKTRVYEAFPAFHILGFVLKVVVPIFTKTVPVYGPPRPPSAGVTKFVLENVEGIKAIIMPPSIWEELTQDSNNLSLLDQLEFVCYAGGPMSAACGAKILQHTSITSFYGSTEMGQIHQLIPHPEDWAYFELNPAAKQQMQLADEEKGLYELVLPIDKSMRAFSSLSHNYPQLKEWRTKDLFIQHQSKPGLWKFYGRNDDIIVLSSGEKLFPIPFEQQMLNVPGVSGVLVIGHKRPRTALLLEVSPDQKLDDVKQGVEKQLSMANASIPDFGRITLQRVVWITGEKRLLRAPKGTVIRRSSEELFSAEIEQLFSEPIASSSTFVLRPTTFDKSAIINLVRATLQNSSLASNVELQDNLFSAGLDSIKTVDLIQQLKAAILGFNPSLNLSWLSLDIIYNNPTIDGLAEILVEFLNRGVVPKREDPAEAIQTTLKQYIKALPTSRIADSMPTATPGRGYTIAITGTTGFLGSKFLSNLLALKDVTRIICLNRDPNAKEKLASIIKGSEKELDFFTIDLTARDIGLNLTEIQTLLQDMDQLIHVAWPVDFNASLQAYEPNFAGLVNLIELCNRSAKHAKFFFVSSITSGGLWSTVDTKQTVIPETIIEDTNIPGIFGYGQSKFVAENILASATMLTGLNVCIARIAYLFSNATERKLPTSSSDMTVTLVETCKAIQCVPNDMLEINWISVADAASILSELVVHSLVTENGVPLVYNVANPNPLAFADAVSSLQVATNASRAVTLKEWLQQVQSAQTRLGIERLPALKMYRSYEQVIDRKAERSIATGQLTTVSAKARSLAPITPELVKGWFESM